MHTGGVKKEMFYPQQQGPFIPEKTKAENIKGAASNIL